MSEQSTKAKRVSIAVAGDEEKQEWDEHARNHFDGSKSEMVRTYVRLCMNQGMSEIDEDILEEHQWMKGEIEMLREENKKLNQQLGQERAATAIHQDLFELPILIHQTLQEGDQMDIGDLLMNLEANVPENVLIRYNEDGSAEEKEFEELVHGTLVRMVNAGMVNMEVKGNARDNTRYYTV